MASTPSEVSEAVSGAVVTSSVGSSSSSTVTVTASTGVVSIGVSSGGSTAGSVSEGGAVGLAGTSSRTSTAGNVGVVTHPIVPGSLMEAEEEVSEPILTLFMDRLEGDHESMLSVVAGSSLAGESSEVPARGGEAETPSELTPAVSSMQAGRGSSTAPPWDSSSESVEASTSQGDIEVPRRTKRRRIRRPVVEESEEEAESTEVSTPVGRHGPLATTLSWSWDHFTLPEGGTVSYSPSVACKHCGKEVKRGNPMKEGRKVCLGTTSLISHLRNRHKEVYAAHFAADRAGSDVVAPVSDVRPPSQGVTSRKGRRVKAVGVGLSGRDHGRHGKQSAKTPTVPAGATPLRTTATPAEAAAAAALFPPQNEVGSLYVPPPGNYAKVPIYYGVDLVCRVCRKRLSCGEMITEAREGSIFLHYYREHPQHLPSLLHVSHGPVREPSSSSTPSGNEGEEEVGGSPSNAEEEQ